jgi:hypothetical protein
MLCGYLYGVDSLYVVPGFGFLPLDTALCFLLLGTGTMVAQSDRGLMSVLAADNRRWHACPATPARGHRRSDCPGVAAPRRRGSRPLRHRIWRCPVRRLQCPGDWHHNLAHHSAAEPVGGKATQRAQGSGRQPTRRASGGRGASTQPGVDPGDHRQLVLCRLREDLEGRYLLVNRNFLELFRT